MRVLDRVGGGGGIYYATGDFGERTERPLWAYRLLQPGIAERVEVPDNVTPLSEGQLRLRLRAAGICGSDMPRFKGIAGPLEGGDYGTVPVHEVVAEVIESTSREIKPGQRVVGTLGRYEGLAELFVASSSTFIPVPDGLDDVSAVVIQPLGTIVRAAATFPPDIRGWRATVIGVGPCGLAFCHLLKRRGAAHVSAIDPVERKEVASAFGADQFFHMPSSEWLSTLQESDRPHLVVEAVGHQQATVRDALHGVADGGFVFGFGEPDDRDYTVPYEEIYLRDLTLASGRTMGNWPEVLRSGAEYLLKHRADFSSYISHVVPVEDTQRAYSLYAQPQVGRLKVVIVP